MSTTRCFSYKSAEEIYQLTEQMATLNEQQIFAEENILDGHNIVLTGQAGTGKTFMLKAETAFDAKLSNHNLYK